MRTLKTAQFQVEQIMKTTTLMMLVMVIATALFFLLPNLSWAE
jgi:hypothetical protein